MTAATTTSAPSAFNSSDDALFSNLLHSHILGSNNQLYNISPSAINFTADCWATLDLFSVSYNSTDSDVYSRLEYIANALILDLPYENGSHSVLDINEYWQAILGLPNAQNVLQGAIQQCNATRGFSIPRLDFTSDCIIIAGFWATGIYPEIPQDDLFQQWSALLQASLIPPYANMSNSTIASITQMFPPIMLVINNPLAGLQSQENLLSKYKESLLSSAATCALPACQALEFGGADVAGVGALVSYAFIVGITSLAIGLVLFCSLKKNNPNVALRKSILASFIVFSDTLVWFGLFALLGLLVDQANNRLGTETVFEYAISTLVGLLTFNALMTNVLLSFSSLMKFDKSFMEQERVLSMCFVIGTALGIIPVTIINVVNMEHSLARFSDMPCYASGLWPVGVLKIALFPQISTVVISFLAFCFRALNYMLRRKPLACFTRRLLKQNIPDILLFIVFLVDFLLLWTDLGLIVYTRNRGRAQFGDSYTDSILGYGQVISMGLPAQFLWTFTYRVIFKNYPKQEESEDEPIGLKERPR